MAEAAVQIGHPGSAGAQITPTRDQTDSDLAAAPFYADVAEGPETGRAVWLTTSDGVRLRVGLWPHPDARGTVLILPGRTEYIEKYGRAAAELAQRGFATIALDWRGQGLSDRLGPTRSMGHVEDFQHFQRDVAALMSALPALTGPNLPAPQCLVAHSMSGAIMLRALINCLPQAAGIRCAAFTGPMWDIAFTPYTRPIAGLIARLACAAGLGRKFAPGTSGETYVNKATFEDNSLTTDPEMWDYMRRQLASHPDLSLSGPSMRWLDGALREGRAFVSSALPDVPTQVYLGSSENIVSQDAMRALCARWPSATLDVLDGKEHEVMMEDAATRAHVFDGIARLAAEHGTPPPSS